MVAIRKDIWPVTTRTAPKNHGNQHVPVDLHNTFCTNRSKQKPSNDLFQV